MKQVDTLRDEFDEDAILNYLKNSKPNKIVIINYLKL